MNRGNFENLVRYYAGNHMTVEEDHNWNYKTPWWFVTLNYTLAWWTSGYVLLISVLFLGDLGKVILFKNYLQ